MKCLIIASNHINKLSNDSQCKASTKLLGLSLIERSIRSAHQAGASEIIVLANEKDGLKGALSKLSYAMGISINTLEEELKSPKDCIAAVCRLQKYFSEPFLLMTPMDIVDCTIIKKLLHKPIREGEIVIAIDTNKENEWVDLNLANKAFIKNGRVAQFGRGVSNGQGYDTGVYLCTPIFFKALQNCGAKGHFSLQAAITLLTQHNRVKAINAGGLFWIAVKDSASLKRAETAMLTDYASHQTDDRASRVIHRPISVFLASQVVNLKVTPQQLRIATYACGLLASIMFFANSFMLAMLAGILTFLMAVLDGVDRHVAALIYQDTISSSEFYDSLFENFSELLILLGFTWHVYVVSDSIIAGLLGFLAIIGILAQNQFLERGANNINEFRFGRGLFSLVLLAGLLINMPMLSLLTIAIYCNAIVAYTFYFNKRQETGRFA